ncbi:MAG TPA: nucleotide exchange factor GrpE [Candidatus Parabacteroides intestinipullorum]|jgi:molecular chaperone GrpE|uniref:Protein GrpE n=1 Tax=Candidatus Parabacteroides intestinipullorum TaxID=2838723 RepID=A0A9D1XAU6_9BACT|nr:nucleotide exchange factor GrpE [Candidatus Parabacteroides intestinipullorum]
MNSKEKQEKTSKQDLENPEEMTNVQDEQPQTAEAENKSDKKAEEAEDYKKKYEELNEAHLRLRAEFDNYRKRTLREKADLIKNGGETALKNLLPVVDDFERAMQNISKTEDVAAVKEGLDLIYSKFMNYLAQQGVKPVEAIGKAFDTELFEAIATIPAPEADMKGKVIDCVQTGYSLFDKVIRHAKVVVGE